MLQWVSYQACISFLRRNKCTSREARSPVWLCVGWNCGRWIGNEITQRENELLGRKNEYFGDSFRRIHVCRDSNLVCSLVLVGIVLVRTYWYEIRMCFFLIVFICLGFFVVCLLFEDLCLSIFFPFFILLCWPLQYDF